MITSTARWNRRRRFGLLAFAIAILSIVAFQAGASTISTAAVTSGTGSGTYYCLNGNTFSPNPTSASCGAGYPTGGLGYASASANYGTLGAYASSGGAGGAFATAQFIDSFTIGLPGCSVATCALIGGDIRIYVSIEGTASVIGGGSVRGTLNADLLPSVNGVYDRASGGATITPTGGTYGVGSSNYYQSGTCGIVCTILLDVPYTTLGESYQLTLGLQAVAGPLATADFSHTVTVDSIGAYDPNGNLLPGALFSFTSGATYPMAAAPTSVPEPASLSILASGLFGMHAAVRRRRRKAA